MAPLALRPAAPSDGGALTALFEAVHRRPAAADLWHWRYHGRPAGSSLGTVGEAGGTLVSHVGTLLFPARGPGGPLTLGLWTDLMVHPAHRGLDPFMALCEAHLDACRAAGADLLYAFPNDNSRPLLRRLFEFDDLGDLAAHEGPLAAPPPVPAAEGLPAEDELDGLWRELRAPDALALERGGAWARWRFAERPGAPYGLFHVRRDGRLRGWAAAKVFEGPAGRVGDVLEFLAAGPADADALWSAALSWMARRGAGTVSAWAAPGDPLAAAWRARGLAPAGPRTHFIVKPLTGAGRAAAADASRWRLSKGDSDVF